MDSRSIFFVLCAFFLWIGAKSDLRCGIAQLRGKRDQMEDRALCLCPFIKKPGYPHICFLALFDGHEGSQVSQYLSNHFHRQLEKAILKIKPAKISADLLEKVLLRELTVIEESLHRKVKRGQISKDVGSTAIVSVVIENEFALIANVGNSRAVICGIPSTPESQPISDDCGDVRGQVLFTSESHSPNNELERRRIESTGSTVNYLNGAWRIDDGLEISRSIGDWESKPKGVISVPEVQQISLSKNIMSILLMSDGVYDKLVDNEICMMAAEVKNGCPISNKTHKPDPAIPLPGVTLPETQDGCEAPRLGLDLSLSQETMHLGLKGCLDCVTSQTCQKNIVPRSTFSQDDFGERENRMATALIQEAYNRRSSDNLAVAMLSFDVAETKAVHPMVPDVSGLYSGMVIKSQNSAEEYELMDRVMAIPRPERHPLHNKWLQLLQTSNKESEIERCAAAYNQTDPQPLALFVPMASSRADGMVRIPVEERLRESCAAPYRLDSVNEQLLGVLGMLPIQDAGGSQSRQLTTEQNTSSKFNASTDYELEENFAAGGFGDVWRAHRRGSEPTTFILKRLKTEQGEEVFLSGLREAYFGSLFQQHSAEESNHLVRFIESIELESGKEMWLVFRDEGVSLHSLMYESNEKDGYGVVEPGAWWRRLRQSRQNEIFELRLIQQLLQAVAVLQSKNTTHRDIKPENVLIDGSGEPDPSTFTIRLIDFGSAIDEVSMKNYYGKSGPSEKEQTKEYAPPEALFEKLMYDADLAHHYYAYDMWSIGILWLEFIMGTPHVFQLPQRTRSKLILELRRFKLTEDDRERAFLLRSLMEFCIYPPRSYTHQGETFFETISKKSTRKSLISWSCTETFLHRLLKSKDANSVGISSISRLRLLMELLTWNPYDRIRAKDALQDEIFQQ